MPARKKVSDEVLLEAYQRLESVWRVAEEVGMCGQSVHERLVRLESISKVKTIKRTPDEFSFSQQRLIVSAYNHGFKCGDGTLRYLMYITGKSKQNICRWARRNGLTNRFRKNDPKLVQESAARTREYHKNNEHPRGALGYKHTDEAKRKMGIRAKATFAKMTDEQKAARTLKILKTREERGILYPGRDKTTWKSGWREIGGVRKYYRSRWEANYARYLEFLKLQGEISEWEHEPETFWFEKIKRGTMSYLPDFRVTRNDGTQYYVEVKGYMDDRSKTKLKRMKKYFPDVELELVASKAYKRLAKTASKLIPDWE